MTMYLHLSYSLLLQQVFAERKLGNAGFGHVYIGRKVTGGSCVTAPDALEV